MTLSTSDRIVSSESAKPPYPQALNSRVVHSTALVALLLAMDKLAGIMREAVVGHAFGAAAALDAYYAAFELPEGLNTIVAGPALTSVLVPLIVGLMARDDHDDLWRFISVTLHWILIVLVMISAVGIVLARPIIVTVAPGFADQPAQIELSVRLMRLVLLQTLLFSIGTVVTGAMEAHQHFLVPALSPLCYTLGRIFGAAILARPYGIFGLAWGGLIGAVVQLLIRIPWLVRRRARWTFTLFHPDLPNLVRLMAPRMLGMSVSYVTLVLPTTFGSQLPGGSIAAYEYASKLIQFPKSVLGTALGITILPALAALVQRGDLPELRRTFSWTLRLVLVLTIPAAVGVWLLGRPLTALVLQRGAFDAAATDRVYWALQFLALGLVAHCALEVLPPLFYAQRDMWTPFWIAAAGLAMNILLGQALLSTLAHGAIALSNSAGACLQVVFLLLVAHRRLGGIEGRQLGASLLRTGIASALMGGALVAFRWALPDTGRLVSVGGGLAVGVLVYGAAACLLNIREIRELPALWSRRREPV